MEGFFASGEVAYLVLRLKIKGERRSTQAGNARARPYIADELWSWPLASGKLRIAPEPPCWENLLNPHGVLHGYRASAGRYDGTLQMRFSAAKPVAYSSK